MFDAEDLKEDGLDLSMVAYFTEMAMFNLEEKKSEEAKWLLNHLEYIRDQCELYED